MEQVIIQDGWHKIATRSSTGTSKSHHIKSRATAPSTEASLAMIDLTVMTGMAICRF
jgi:hypothetical protein